MASSSTSSIRKNFKYHVFLCFRGEDTRTKIVDHLYASLTRLGIHTFRDRDNEELEKGKRIDKLFDAIEESSDIRHQSGPVKKVTAKAIAKDKTNEESWKKALKDTGNVDRQYSFPKTKLKAYGDYGSVWKLFRDSIKKGPYPSNITFNVMIHGFCKRGEIQTGESLFHIMTKFKCEPDVYTYNILINAYCIHGQTSNASNWVDLMVKRGCTLIKCGVTPSSSTSNSLLMCLSRNGTLLEAEELMCHMREKGKQVNKMAFIVIIDGYFKIGDVMGAQRLWGFMKKTNLSPDAVSFSAYIDGLSKAGLIEEAYNMFLEMKAKRVFPNNFTYNSLIAGFINAED
ncbi:hypothetical protein LXL04_010590 [Taraxacum kok-saghyz]